MNKNAIPTVIRETKIVPGSRVWWLTNRIEMTRDMLGDYGRPPSLEWKPVLATNGTSFAFGRKGWRNDRNGVGPFAYVNDPESDRYYVSEAEAQAALTQATGPDVATAITREISASLDRINSEYHRLKRLRARLTTLKADAAKPEAVAPPTTPRKRTP
jgi:hypothetical protein